MSRSSIALLGVVLCLAGLVGGYFKGLADGGQARAAKQDKAMVADLTGVLKAHAGLVKQTNIASAALRKATADRALADEATTQELKDVLQKTSPARADCRHDAGVMRHLQGARDRATRAAAGGTDGAVPSAATSDGK